MADLPREIDPTHQPTPEEYKHKRSLFSRLQDMAVQMQQMRRALGYQWLEGGMTAMEGSDQQIVHARQSGLIVVSLVNPSPHLHVEPVEVAFHDKFHRTLIPADTSLAVGEYRWDEAMFADRQT